MNGLPQPRPEQLSWFLRKFKENVIWNENTIKSVKDLVKQYPFNDNLSDEQPFFFGVEADEYGEPKIVSGKTETFCVGITTKKLLKYCEIKSYQFSNE